MPTPLDDIKAGITTSSWKKVVKGYERLTGEKLECPREKGGEEASEPLKVALQFYAHPNHWKRGGDDLDPTPALVASDRGDIARKVLGWTPETARDAPEEMPGKPEEEEDEEDEPPPPPPAYERRRKTPISQFSVSHGEVKPDKGDRACRREPFVPPKPGTNQFVPNEELEAAEKRTTQWINENVKPTRRRPRGDSYFIDIKCPKCGVEYEVTREEVEAKEEWVCLRCVRSQEV